MPTADDARIATQRTAARDARGVPAEDRGTSRSGGAPERVRNPADDCVHCGFCLPVCPTWQSWQEEMDSPRGRIDLFQALEDGRVAMSPVVAEHFDRCLGCMACMTACPSGVRYDHVIEAARFRVERELRRAPADRLHRAGVFALFPRPGRLRGAALLLWAWRASGLQRLARRLGLLRFSRRLAALDALAPVVPLRDLLARLPERTPARGARRLRAGLVTGCVQRVFFPGVNAATVRVLAAEGVDVVAPRRQGCCGALSLHVGREAEARRLTRRLIERFEREAIDVVVVNAAGCGSHLKDVGALFEGDPFEPRARAFAARVKDVTELLAALPPRARRAALRARVAYHSPCHLGHAQRVNEPPRALLRTIPELELVEVPDGEQCCGSAGVYNLVEPEAAVEIGRRKAEAVLSTRATLLASANPGCSLHIRRMLAERGAELPAAHPIELLDRAIRAAEEADSGRPGASPPPRTL
ncbi:(Fe-S)-binding protein [Anaeromyxobacter sp. SG66]|uniref:(Fe-S)-binding protein n=1 Tax=Anaeromyxobacter sp. SG66 TaxID=2925410 RepID=UPI001F56591E|nr:(Fe-S)-binding protein [Anaeromyxobacter sp. SG66]